MAVFMKVDSAKGGATAKGYEGWTAIHGVSIGAGRHVGVQTAREAYFDNGAVCFSSVDLSFNHDPMSAGVWTHLCKGNVIPSVEINVCHASDSLQPYLKLILEYVVVSDHHTQIVSGGLPHEQITLHCRRITRTDIFSDGENGLTQQAVGFDVGTQQTL
jgi:type VI protein secretion system component Hcp